MTYVIASAVLQHVGNHWIIIISLFRKPEEEKERFWNEVIHLVSCIPHNKMVVLASDMNEHVESSNVGYDRTHGGFGYGLWR